MIHPKDEKEARNLAQFRKNTADLEQDEDISLKFLRAREGNLEKAEDMLRKSVKWRLDKNVSQYLDWDPPTKLAKEFGYTYEFIGEDYGGRPVLRIPFGNYKSKELILQGYKDEVPKMTYHILENCVKRTRDKNMSQFFFIMDLENLSIWQVLHRESMQMLHSSFQDLEMNYPEILFGMFVINAPKYFSIAYKILRPILSDYTVSKIQIFDTDKKVWLPELLNKMPKEILPKGYINEISM